MARLCVFVGFWEDAVAMKRLLDNLLQHGIELVICIDGKHPLMPCSHGGNVSLDGSHELIKSYPNTILFYDNDKFKGLDKVNYAFRYAAMKGFDYVLILGCDEFIEGDIDQLLLQAFAVGQYGTKQSVMMNVKFEDKNQSNKHARMVNYLPRLFRYPMFVRTRDVHWFRYFNDKRLVAEYNLDGITICHDNAIRPVERDKLMDELQRRQIPIETKIVMHTLGVDIAKNQKIYRDKYCKKCGIERGFVMGRCITCNTKG